MIYWFYKLLARIPLRLLYILAGATAWLLEYVFRYRRQVVETNLLRALPDLDEADRHRIRHDFYRRLTDVTVEIIRGSRLPSRFFVDRVDMLNPELLTELSRSYQQSVIVMTLHQGNWEWMLQRARAEYPIAGAAVYKRLHSAGADRFTYENRSRFGAEPVEMRDAARNLLRHRRSPRFIFMVADQSPGLRERVHWVDFLNQKTAFFSGAATIARATGFPVAFAQCLRNARGHYQIQLSEITRDPKALSENQIINRYASLCEQAILNSPADWLWSNRRWKHPAPSEDS